MQATEAQAANDTFTTENPRALAPLVYRGVTLRERDGLVNLTDAWRASGSPDGKRPANWTRKEGAEFIETLRNNLNVPVGHIDILRSERG